MALFTLYCVLCVYETIPRAITHLVQEAMQELEQAAHPLTGEQRQLLTVLSRKLSPVAPSLSRSAFTGVPPRETADERATRLYAFGKQPPEELGRQQVEEVLAACTDTREISESIKAQVGQGHAWQPTVQNIAWGLTNLQFSMGQEVWRVVAQALDDEETIICAGAARLLQHGKNVRGDTRTEATRRIMELLADDERSRRPLNTPEYGVWRLDDVLFGALEALGG